MLLGLVSADLFDGGLFDWPDDSKSLARMNAVDALNRKFCRDTITSPSIDQRDWHTARTQ